VADTCAITCAKTKLKCILEYLEEGWLGKAQNKVQGVIMKYDPENDSKLKVRDVPEKDVLARIEGSWTDKVYYTLGGAPFAKTTVCASVSLCSFRLTCHQNSKNIFSSTLSRFS